MNHAKEYLFGIFVVLLLARKTIAQNRNPGRCPDVSIQPNYNASDFSGRWFEYVRTPRPEEDGGKCIFFEYLPPVDARVTINRRKISIATNKEDFHSGQVTVLVPGQAISADYYDYRVVSTDYTNYAVIYACKNQNLSRHHLSQLWILTREPIPLQKYVDQAYRVIEENGITQYNLIKTDQKNCPEPSKDPLPTNFVS